MRRHSLWTVAVVSMVGCVPESREERLDPEAVCDGSSGLRVAVRYGGGGPLGPFDVFSQALGWSTIFVNGECRFWTDADHLEMRSGTLTKAEWTALAQRLRYADWNRWSGDYGTQWPDQGGRQFWTGTPAQTEATFVTYSVCEGSQDPVPPGLCETSRAASEIADELAVRGGPVDGDVWVAAQAVPDHDVAVVHRWPLPQLDLATLAARSSEHTVGQQRVTGEDARTLRALRQAAFESERAYATTFWVTDAAESLFKVAIRDTVPFEDEDGTVRLP